MRYDATGVASTACRAGLSVLQIETRGPVVHLRLNRPAKRNAINDELIAQIHTAFVNLPPEAGVVVVSGEGDHFCAGLDLSELSERSVAEGMLHSRAWHAATDPSALRGTKRHEDRSTGRLPLLRRLRRGPP